MAGVISKVHLGVPVVEADGRLVVFAEAHADLTAFQPYVVNPSYNSGDSDGKAVTAAPGTSSALQYVGIPQQGYAKGEIAKLIVGGACKSKLAAETVVAGDYLEVLNAGTTMMVDGTSGSTSRSAKGLGMACEANSGSAGVFNVQLLGIPGIISAS